MILGMDTGVFAAWILTILAAITCVAYGIYFEFIKKNRKKETKKEDNKRNGGELV